LKYLNNNRREQLLAWTSATLAELSGEVLVNTALEGVELPAGSMLVAVGKAAAAMACGAVRRVGGEHFKACLVITREGHAGPWRACLQSIDPTVIEAGHPVPDARSLEAGATLLKLLTTESTSALLLLISGGASSLVEVLPPDLVLDDLQRANAWLLGSGMDIVRMNAVRRRLSLIKGGGLLRFLNGRAVHALALSDVLGDAPAAIGSGLVSPPATDDAIPSGLPDWLTVRLEPVRAAPAPVAVDYRIIANNRTACEAFARRVRAAGVPAILHETPLTGDARATGERLAHALRQATGGVHIWGGETTVQLPAQRGTGGRCQQLALAAARFIEGDPRIQLLALGTDGSDGPTDDAGALVDGGTAERGRLAALDPLDCLVRADAGRFLEASGDLVATGPTGTNLNDLVVGWVYDD